MKNSVLERLPDDFNWEIYCKLNGDVGAIYNNKESAEKHYLTDGYKQNRRYVLTNIPTNFNWSHYLALNLDVYHIFKTEIEACIHYNDFGYKENRKYYSAGIPDNFNWEIYLYLNPKLSTCVFDQVTGILHYQKEGESSKLSYQFKNVPNNFNWKLYCEFNTDVQQICKTEMQSKIHYETDGFYQNRRYYIDVSKIPDDFDWKMYLMLNPDVNKLHGTENQAKLHYTTAGIVDKRSYKFMNVPSDFNCKLYLELNDTIDTHYKQSKFLTKLHYETLGFQQGLPCKIDFTNIPSDFDWEYYRSSNPSLSGKSKILCMKHYNTYGYYQLLKYKSTGIDIPVDKTILKDASDINALWIKNPFLFHKYILHISQPISEIDYTIYNPCSYDINSHFEMVTHIHCYDISRFDDFFGVYISEIQAHSSLIVITYCIGENDGLLDEANSVLLHCENIGMDIGGKFACIQYLKQASLSYDTILFLHSKTDDSVRKTYMDPLIHNLSDIKTEFLLNTKIGIYVPPLVYLGDYANIIYNNVFVEPHNVTCKWNLGNTLYMHELDDYLQFDSTNYLFPEGNCFVCKRSVAEKLYSDVYLYRLLNTKNSFDACWVKAYYGGRLQQQVGNSIYDIYDYFKQNKTLHPNNTGWGAGHKGHPDNMFEHCFERIVFKVVQKLGFEMKIAPSEKGSDYLTKLVEYEQKINAMFYPKSNLSILHT